MNYNNYEELIILVEDLRVTDVMAYDDTGYYRINRIRPDLQGLAFAIYLEEDSLIEYIYHCKGIPVKIKRLSLKKILSEL